MGKEKSNTRLLTEVELELMHVVWKLGECTVKDVQGALPPDRQLAYTSVATMMKILEGKKVLASGKADRVITYRALVSRADYEGKALRHVAERLFEGSPSSMVMRLLDEAELTKEDIESIRRHLEARVKK